jgi:hypothetical protein
MAIFGLLKYSQLREPYVRRGLERVFNSEYLKSKRNKEINKKNFKDNARKVK